VRSRSLSKEAIRTGFFRCSGPALSDLGIVRKTTGGLSVAIALLIGELQKTKQLLESSGALLFDAAGAELPIFDQRVIHEVSQALRHAAGTGVETRGVATCGLTGHQSRLLSGSFPQPNLPVLGRPSSSRGTPTSGAGSLWPLAAEAMPAGEDTVIRLAAALRRSPQPIGVGITWRPIPGEAPQQSDLLLAFIESAPEVATAGLLARKRKTSLKRYPITRNRPPPNRSRFSKSVPSGSSMPSVRRLVQTLDRHPYS